MGLRFQEKYNGKGLDWPSEVVTLEEIGVSGTALACLYTFVSIVGEPINVFGTKKINDWKKFRGFKK